MERRSMKPAAEYLVDGSSDHAEDNFAIMYICLLCLLTVY